MNKLICALLGLGCVAYAAQNHNFWHGVTGAILIVMAVYLVIKDSRLTIRWHHEMGFLIIKISGPLCLGTGANALRQVIEESLANGDHKIILDLKGATRLDDFAVTEIAELAKIVRDRIGDIQCYGLRLTDGRISGRLAGTIAVHEDEVAALCHFPSKSGIAALMV